MDRPEVDAGVVPDARLVGGPVVGRVGVDPGLGWQAIEEVVEGGAVVVTRGEQGAGNGDAVGGADQVQAPTADLVLLGGALAAVGASAPRAAAPRAHTTTDRPRQAVDHDGAAGGWPAHDDRAAQVEEQVQPGGQRV